jgi:hypothetical protein
MKTWLQISVIAFIASVSLALLSARNAGFEWPDSHKYWRALVNINQYIAVYMRDHPQWFSQDKLVTDFYVINVPRDAQDQARNEYHRVRKLLESKGMYVGTYMSGMTVIPQSEQKYYPANAVATEEMPDTARYVGAPWAKEPHRKLIDGTDANTRHALQAGIRKLWASVPAALRFVDNIQPPRTQPWKPTCEHITELRKIGESLGSRVIFNISLSIGEMSDDDVQRLIDAIGQGGWAVETPWEYYIRQSKGATARAEKRYRQLLDTGMAIIMIPAKTPEDELANWVSTWRKPSDHLYLSIGFTKPPSLAILSPR